MLRYYWLDFDYRVRGCYVLVWMGLACCWFAIYHMYDEPGVRHIADHQQVVVPGHILASSD